MATGVNHQASGNPGVQAQISASQEMAVPAEIAVEQAVLALVCVREQSLGERVAGCPCILECIVPLTQDLNLERLWVVYPGKIGYPMDEKIECVSLSELDGIRETLEC
jgi:hypothetical protein